MKTKLKNWSKYDRNTQLLFEEADDLLRSGESIDIDEYVNRVSDPDNNFRERFRRELEDQVSFYCESTYDTKTFVGPYQVRELIGNGANADVYRVYDTDLQEHIAIKIPRENPFSSNKALRAFRKEVMAMAKTRHRNVVQVYGTSMSVDDDCYIAMELIEGPRLLDIDADEYQAAAIVLQILKGLRHIHSKGPCLK